jgi:hypothetical protein
LLVLVLLELRLLLLLLLLLLLQLLVLLTVCLCSSLLRSLRGLQLYRLSVAPSLLMQMLVVLSRLRLP